MMQAGSRPRSRHRLRTLLIVLAVLAGLLVAADRVGDYVAERVAAAQLQKSQGLRTEPGVDVAGFPFLTQLASDDYDKITVTAHDLDLADGSRTTHLDTLTTVLRDVHTSRNFHHVHAGSLTATGTTTLASIGSTLGYQLRAAGNGRVAVTKTVTVLGSSLTATVSAKPVVRDGELAFEDTQIDNAGSLAATVSRQVTSLFDITVPLQNVPFHLVPRSVAVTGSQVRFTLDGSDVDLSSR